MQRALTALHKVAKSGRHKIRHSAENYILDSEQENAANAKDTED